MMIFDRTAEMVENAIKIREDKIKKGEQLTDEDILVIERGFINVDTINRIESKQAELKQLFNNMGYYNTPVVSKSWRYGDYFLKSDLQRIVSNNEILKSAYFVFSTTPKSARARPHFQDFNNIEKSLYDLEIMANDMISRFRMCGTFNCGG